MDYHSLENAEKENYRLMKKKKKRMAAKVTCYQLFLIIQNFAQTEIDQKLTQNISTKKVKMGFNFTIRP
jgi:TPP-dependent 2-oxoacid decarboxylase